MGYEIELKAWVDDYEKTEQQLRANFTFVRRFLKEDVYYDGLPYDNIPAQRFRIRKDGDKTICTFKQKQFKRNMEFNEEKEFEVSSADQFEQFVQHLGARLYIRKQKSGMLFTNKELNIELVHVATLGDFLEIEKLLDKKSEEEFAWAEQEIRNTFSLLGIQEVRFEGRPYIKLLEERH